MGNLIQLRKELHSHADKDKAALLQRFFKTGKGEYGEGDIFLGINVPLQRAIARKHPLTLAEIQQLLDSKIHEERLVALFCLMHFYVSQDKKEAFDFYLKNTSNINNWDLVDCSSPNILGDFLLDKDRKILYKLANSSSLWEKRIAIVSTFTFIRKNNEFDDTLRISEILLKDKHDLIHKAVGWMLREVGKKDINAEKAFLDKHAASMPRTMLRYAIEKFPEKERKYYLNK